jgi:hypothetical protein
MFAVNALPFVPRSILRVDVLTLAMPVAGTTVPTSKILLPFAVLTIV